MQNGVSYAAGQLLAVVASKTVLVVDAPTDWSLAGPLWELALDDAPVEEVLDVLVRRGIRTTPSFAIVRVEGEAVRAVVRGSVAVCFERIGEPVRLDARGATTWLEGLISGATRVLVGEVEQAGALPFLVHTGVVLVSGLAVPTSEPAGTSAGRRIDLPTDTPVALPGRDRPTPVVVPAAAGAPAAGPARVAVVQPVARAEPGVAEPVARAEPGVAEPVVVEPGLAEPVAAEPVAAEPSLVEPGALGVGGEVPRSRVVDLTRLGPRTGSQPVAPPPAPLAGRVEPAVEHSEPAAEPAESTAEPVELAEPAEQAEQDVEPHVGPYLVTAAPPALPAPPRALPSWRPDVIEVDDDAWSLTAAAAEAWGVHDDEPAASADRSLAGAPGPQSALEDDLLLERQARGPLPTALPNFDPPSVALTLPGLSTAHRRIAPHDPAEADPDVADLAEADVADPADLGDPEVFERVEQSFDDYVRSRADNQDDLESERPDALPLRVRGQTLRPEHRVPFGTRSTNGTWPRAGENAGSPFIPTPSGPNGHAPEEPYPSGNQPPAEAPESSGGLLLPAFFRGARAARSKTHDATPDHPAPVWARGSRRDTAADDTSTGSLGTAPGSAWGSRSESGSGELSGLAASYPTGLGAGRFARPGQLGGGPGSEPTSDGAPAPQPPREPPRLLGVWCDAGHVTSPDQPACRVCGLRVPPQAPILVARPPLGVLVFDNGDRVEVDRPVVLGRDPKPVPSPDPEAAVLHAVSSTTGQVSRTHAEVRASGWDVVITDLDAMNGTSITSSGGAPLTIEPGVPTVIGPGTRVDLGGEAGFVFDVEG